MSFCTKCGARLPDGSKFCTECGQRIADVQPVPAAPVSEPVQQTYEAPAQQSYTPPVQQTYEAPAQQSYTPPVQQTYEAPAQQSYTPPVQQTYEAPAQQSYTPPVQQTYEAPAQQSYTPPAQQSYASPVQAGGGSYVPPVPPAKPPKQKKSGGGRIGLFIGIGVAVVAVIVLLVVLLSGKGDKNDPNLGRYEGVSCVYDGIDVGAEGEWIELKAKGKGEIKLMGETFSIKWSVKDDVFTLKQSGTTYEGTLKDGVITIEFSDLLYTFRKEGTSAGKTDNTGKIDSSDNTGNTGNAAAEVGYWTLLRVDSSNPDNAMSEDDVALFASLGMEFYIDFKDNGSVVIVFDGPEEASWANGTITAEDGTTLPYTVTDEELHIQNEDMDMVFVRGEGSAPEIDWSAQTGDWDDGDDWGDEYDGPHSWWSGTWYGWLVFSNASSYYEDMIDNCYDCVAEIYVYEDDTGYVEIYSLEGETIAEASVIFSAGVTENGCMMSESGTILDLDIDHGDWIVDPGASTVSCFEHMIRIDGTMFDSEGDWIDYDFYLRPWGMEWEDVRHADTSSMPYDDMMPLEYDDWYLPQLSGAVG